MKKAIAGYHLLMVLTIIDGTLNIKEEIIIKEWLENEFNTKENLDDEMEILSTLKNEDFPAHFQQQMDIFYSNSTHKERMELLQFALFLIKADGVITPEENIYFDMLYNNWNEEKE